MNIWLFLVLGILFGLGYANDTLIQIIKISSAKGHIYKLSYYISAFNIINRISIALYMPILGYYIDTNSESSDYFSLILFLLLGLLAILIGYKFILPKISKRFNFPFLEPELNNLFTIKVFPPLIANLFLGVGSIFPIIMTGYFHDLRATMLQAGILFNFFGTLMFTFVIDKKIAFISEHNSETIQKDYINVLYLSKILSVFILIVMLFLVY